MGLRGEMGLKNCHSIATFPQIVSSVKFFGSSLSTHRGYAVRFLLCECLAFVISIGNLFFTNTFLGGEFFKFGPSALKYLGTNSTDPNNPLNEIFPKVTFKSTSGTKTQTQNISSQTTHTQVACLPLSCYGSANYSEYVLTDWVSSTMKWNVAQSIQIYFSCIKFCDK